MPLKAEYITKLRHSSDMIATLCMAMAASAVTSLPNIYTNRTRQVFNYFREIDARSTGIDNPSAKDDDLWKELIYKILH